MVEFSVGLGKFREDLLGELLAEFNTPLVVAVDVPDHALREDLVFVHGDEGAERFRRNVVHHDGVGRLVAFEHLVRGAIGRYLWAFPAQPVRVGLYCKAFRAYLRHARTALATAPQCRPKGSLSLTQMRASLSH